jgi:hypothetical protein
MANLVLAHSTFADAATPSGGSWAAGLPLPNLFTERLYETARSTDATAASTQFVLDLGSAKDVNALIVGPTNMTAAATYRIRGSSTTAFTAGAGTYDSGTIGTGVTSADIDPERGYNIVHLLPSTQPYRYWKVEIVDTANPAGYVEIGRLFMPLLLQPSINYAPGSGGLSIEDMTLRSQTLAGVEIGRRRRNRRVFGFGIPALPQNEAFGTVFRFERTVGFDKQVFLIPDPADITNMQARAFWGRVRAMDALSQAKLSVNFGLTISETF